MLSDEDIDLLKGTHTDKELKKVFKGIASQNPDDYFPTKHVKVVESTFGQPSKIEIFVEILLVQVDFKS